MFTIQYTFASKQKLIAVDAMALRYDLFIGDVRMENESKKFSFEDIPLFDFLVGLNLVYKDLIARHFSIADFEFTESDEKLLFNRTNDKLQITATYCDEIITVDFIDFENGLKEFKQHLLADIQKNEPAIYSHPVFVKCLNEIN